MIRRNPQSYSSSRKSKRSREREAKKKNQRAQIRNARTARGAFSKDFKDVVGYYKRVLPKDNTGLDATALNLHRCDAVQAEQNKSHCQCVSRPTLERLLFGILLAWIAGARAAVLDEKVREYVENQKNISFAVMGKVPLRGVPLTTAFRYVKKLTQHLDNVSPLVRSSSQFKMSGSNWIHGLVLPPSYDKFPEFYEYEN